MNDIFIKNLVDFGLSDKEARAYLAVLKLELATANEIAKTAGINRSSGYVVLESLRKRGLVGISDDKKIRKYVAVSPDTLLYAARNAAEEQEKIRVGIENIVPKLNILHKDTERKPRVSLYEGKGSFIASLEDTLTCKEKLLRVASSNQRLNAILPNYLPKYVQRRFKKGLKLRSIHPADDASLHLTKGLPKFDESALIPSKEFKIPADIAIYDDKIGYLSTRHDGYSILVESKELAEVMKNIFDLAWREAKRLNKGLKKKKGKR